MLEDIKKELLKSPDKIAEVLEHYNFSNIKIRDGYITCGRDMMSSPKSIVIWTHDNNWLYLKDYPRNINMDLFSYIMNERSVSFQDVLETVRKILGITDYYSHFEKRSAFGGFYNRVRGKNSPSGPIKTYDKSVLLPYKKTPNLRFLRDGISLESQKFFDIRYDVENSGIVIPILDQVGNIIALKERINREPEPDEQKYWYVLPGRSSRTLYGYCQNYKYLTDNTVMIFESEKSCMQCHSFGIRNCVALGSGSISSEQIKMIYELQPQKVLFLHDVGYEKEAILKNVNAFKNYLRFSEVEVGYWDWEKSKRKDKVSPSDLGVRELKRILGNEMVFV